MFITRSAAPRGFVAGLTVIGSNSAAGTSVTIPTHQAGDLIIISAFRSGSTTVPTVPAGWLNASDAGATSGNTCVMITHSKVAQSSSEVSGTWTSATFLSVVVIRGSGGIGPMANSGVGSSLTLTYPDLAPTGMLYTYQTGLIDTSGTSMILRVGAHRTATNIAANTPAGYTNLSNAGTSGGIRSMISATTGTNPTTATQAVSGTSSGWVAQTLEITAAKPVFDSDAFTSTFDTTRWWDEYDNSGWSVSSGRLQSSGGSGASGAVLSRKSYYLGPGGPTTITWQIPTLPATGGNHKYGWVMACGRALNYPTTTNVMEGIYFNIASGGSTSLSAPNATITGTPTRTTSANNWFQIKYLSPGTFGVYYGTNGTSWTLWVTVSNCYFAGRFIVSGVPDFSVTTITLDNFTVA